MAPPALSSAGPKDRMVSVLQFSPQKPLDLRSKLNITSFTGTENKSPKSTISEMRATGAQLSQTKYFRRRRSIFRRQRLEESRLTLSAMCHSAVYSTPLRVTPAARFTSIVPRRPFSLLFVPGQLRISGSGTLSRCAAALIPSPCSILPMPHFFGPARPHVHAFEEETANCTRRR